MNSLRIIARAFLFLVAAGSFVLPAFAATSVNPDERDRQVLETLLLHLLFDEKFDLTTVPPTGATIILHLRTPKKTGFLSSAQISADLNDGDHQKIPADAESDLRRRNTPPDAEPDTYEAVAADYSKLTFSNQIFVTDLSKLEENRSFEDQFPKARGWLWAYLPGYSKDGGLAVIRALAGPWAHAAMLTAVLEKRGDKWLVRWYKLTRYA